MPVNDETDDRTHEILDAEVDGYDRETAATTAGEWVEQAPAPTDESDATATFELYEDERGQWRWRLVAVDGTVLAGGDTGYGSREDAQRAIDSFKTTIEDAPVVAADSR